MARATCDYAVIVAGLAGLTVSGVGCDGVLSSTSVGVVDLYTIAVAVVTCYGVGTRLALAQCVVSLVFDLDVGVVRSLRHDVGSDKGLHWSVERRSRGPWRTSNSVAHMGEGWQGYQGVAGGAVRKE